jgi:hypothetical protein
VATSNAFGSGAKFDLNNLQTATSIYHTDYAFSGLFPLRLPEDGQSNSDFGHKI